MQKLQRGDVHQVAQTAIRLPGSRSAITGEISDSDSRELEALDEGLRRWFGLA